MKPSMRWIGGVILGWAVLPALLGDAQAEPLALAGPKPSASAPLKSDPASCKLPPELLSRLAELRGSLPRDGLVGARVAALPPERTGPTVLPRPALPPTTPRKAPSRVTALGGFPLAFIENRGQVDPQVKFYVRQGGHTLWLTPSGLVFDLVKAKPAAGQTKSDPSLLPRAKSGPYQPSNTERERLVFAQDFLGARKIQTIEARKPQPGTYNYFLSNDPAKWRTRVRAYAEIVYREVWEGVDLKLYGNGRALEQEFIVKPRGDPSRIRVAYRGIEGLWVAQDGSLVIKTAFGELKESKPRVYQEIKGKRVEVTGSFKLLSETAYSFEVGPYQQQYALVIDPTLVYSTYLGGGAAVPLGRAEDEGFGIAVDSRGQAYVTGVTGSADFPTMVPFQGTPFPSSFDTAFITKLNATGSGLIYSTFFGKATVGRAIAVDSAGAAYVAGDVDRFGEGFVPLSANAAETTLGFFSSAFVAKFLPDGSNFEYSTYSTVFSRNRVTGIAVDPQGNAYIAGDGGCFSPAFVRKLNPTGTSFLYTTLIGTGHFTTGCAEQANGIALDAEGNAYVAGSTGSPDFPTTPGAFQRTFGFNAVAAFVTKLSASGSVVYSTLLTGGLDGRADEATAIAVDLSGHAFVTGTTASSTFPTTPGALDTAFAGSGAFVTKLSADGSALVYSTYLGDGSFFAGTSVAYGIAVDAADNASVVGVTTLSAFPTTSDAFQRVFAGGDTRQDAFLSTLNRDGSNLIYSTYLGGAGDDQALAIALDAIGDAYLTGFTTSAFDFPKAPGFTPFQQLNAGGRDAFVAKFSTGAPSILSISIILPNAGGDTGSVSAIIHGTGLADGATVKLMRSGQPDIVGDPVAVAADGRTVSTTFDLVGKARGAWDVVVTNPDAGSTTLPGGFTIEEGRAPQVWVDIVSRDTILVRRPQTFYVLVGNRGNVNAIGVPLYVTGIPKDATWTLATELAAPPLGAQGLINIDFATIPKHVETENEIAVPLFIPVIPPGFTTVLPLKLSIPSLRDLEIRAFTLRPFFGSPFSDAWTQCILSVGNNFIGRFIPVFDCASAIGSWQSADLYIRNSQFSPGGSNFWAATDLFVAMLNTGIQCGGDVASIGPQFIQVQLIELGADVVTLPLGAFQTFRECAGGFAVASQKEALLRGVNASDPNEKAGSQGAGQAQFISGEEPLRYAIFFENEATATAPAQEVVITDQLDGKKLDLTTFSLGPISFGDEQITPPPGLKQFSTDVDLRPDKNLIVRIAAGLNATGVVTWRFASIDPATGELTEDPLGGFLPPNTEPPKGEGNVVFTVMPKKGLTTGTEIRNKARIVFDLNDPVDTPEWFNTLDNTKPTSQVLPLAATQASTDFPVEWSGTDAHSGILDYTIFVSEDGGSFTPFISNTPDTSATFAGQSGKRYAFFSVARDGAGNTEDAPAEPDATTVVVAADTTPPAIIITTPADGAAFTLNAAVAANYSCSDDRSGVAACLGPVPSGTSIDTATVGQKSFTVNATDVTGNSAFLTHQYSVHYNFAGFFAPIDPLPTLNVARPGRTVPIKWQLTDANGNFVSDLASFASLFSTPIACDAAPSAIVEEEVSATGGTVLRYDSTTNQFVYNWQTSSAWTGCRLLQLTLKDGTQHFAKFSFK